jgi:hypothetical protein
MAEAEKEGGAQNSLGAAIMASQALRRIKVRPNGMVEDVGDEK